jgi:hypothetical protein
LHINEGETKPGMHHAIRATVLSLLVTAACGGSGQAPSATPAPSASAAHAAQVDACRVLTAADVHSALGVAVSPLPMGSPPADGGGGAGSLLGGCTYAATGSSSAGASLFLFADTPVSSFASVPGYRKVPGVGDSAYVSAPRILAQKGHVTFQIVVELDADKATQEQKLAILAKIVASRL